LVHPIHAGKSTVQTLAAEFLLQRIVELGAHSHRQLRDILLELSEEPEVIGDRRFVDMLKTLLSKTTAGRTENTSRI
jgi:hypothetical protein